METVGEGAERRVAPNAEERAEVLMLAIVCAALAAAAASDVGMSAAMLTLATVTLS